MVEASIIIKCQNGLHTRPVARLHNIDSNLVIEYKNHRVSIKRIFKILLLGIKQHETITVYTTDEQSLKQVTHILHDYN